MLTQSFSLAPLPYSLDALEPVLSSQTLSFHHGKHHQAYVTNLNNLVAQREDFSALSLADVVEKTRGVAADIAIFNNAAQVWNHDFFWHSMKHAGGGQPKGELLQQILKDFADYATFRAKFVETALSQFGSGWGWLVWDHSKKSLAVVRTSNADLPSLLDQSPLLTVDVWEHSYYLDYQNRRADYLGAFIDKLVNWEFAEQNFANSVNKK